MKNSLKTGVQPFQKQENSGIKINSKNVKVDIRSPLEVKADYFSSLPASPAKRVKLQKKYYKKQSFYPKYKIRSAVAKMENWDLHKYRYINFLRWVLIDYIRGRRGIDFGIYCFVALPGEGKTMSMVAHAERYRVKMEKAKKQYCIVANFSYVYADYIILDWLELVKIAKSCYTQNVPLLVLWDEIQVSFDSSEWKDFPPELLALLSFVRKYGMEFLCSAQIYDRIPKKIRDITNFVVVCKNIWRRDRLFFNYYYEKENYEFDFSDTKGKKSKAKFRREFVADNKFYALYDTRQQVDRMVSSAKQEKEKRQLASSVLFGTHVSD